MDSTSALKFFGFTKQEAVVYTTLLRYGPQTGYEAAKNAGISRSNAYGALAGLCEKGAAMKASGDAKSYSAVPGKELIRNLRRQCDKTLDVLEKSLPDRQETEAPYLTVSGFENVVDKAQNVLDEAEHHIYVSLNSHEATLLHDALCRATARGLKTVIVSDTDPNVPECIYHFFPKDAGQFNIIADTSTVLTGSLDPELSSQCLYSKNTNLVRLMREAFVNELELIRQREEKSNE
ncbi:TrmB family transcriptional regulator [Desulfobaculum bizertense]|uniref:Transcriptional regulator TrmB n=1 Tax=Desulfobaculum bizertense DSM 18034 TaxID=1121442 RepID=A0A1T4VVS2_9BACT|nr:helix-turn-helix domain-containing protein [Desulfobaculum bizertense]UIJ36737.1 TrmB family transcriptional regulator [Desulfobaculum bizertense]SKA69110.1 transcriptional regulator TrmB [Desulfobaculum bizertense DSM 18034]